ncbi:hypothetical protein R4B61_07620 (plasmid) [Fructilactobacillus vespulae]|uniref:hypothetical protein n=1 Tax=Fructilactobacillus vespulae TaxID=1249630 RepID=UPI0039B3D419
MKYKIKKYFRYLKYHSYVKRWIILGVWLSGFLILVTGALFGNRISNVASTPINQTVNFEGGKNSSTANTALKLVKKAYSPDKKRLILQLKATGNNDVTQKLLAKYVTFKVETLGNSDGEVSVIPVTDNDYIVDINNLEPHFKALRLWVTNDTPITGSTGKSQGKAKFVVNEDETLGKTKVPNKTDNELASDVAKEQIKAVQDDIVTKQNEIETANKTIKADKDREKTLEDNKKYEVASQQKKTEDNLATLRSDIQQNEQIITDKKTGIENNKNKIKLLEKKQKAIENGTFKLPPKQQTTKTKAVN